MGKGRLTAILGGAASVATILTLFLTAGGSPSSSTMTVPSAPPVTPSPYPAAAEQNFLGSCDASSGGATAACQCLLDWFEQHVSFTQFLADEDLARSGRVAGDLAAAEDSCG